LAIHLIQVEPLFKFYEYEVGIELAGLRVKSLGGHFACLCREFDFYEVKKKYYYFSKSKGKLDKFLVWQKNLDQPKTFWDM
jgi:hypothetical protein